MYYTVLPYIKNILIHTLINQTSVISKKEYSHIFLAKLKMQNIVRILFFFFWQCNFLSRDFPYMAFVFLSLTLSDDNEFRSVLAFISREDEFDERNRDGFSRSARLI